MSFQISKFGIKRATHGKRKIAVSHQLQIDFCLFLTNIASVMLTDEF
jgi:hypothetical protein